MQSVETTVQSDNLTTSIVAVTRYLKQPAFPALIFLAFKPSAILFAQS